MPRTASATSASPRSGAGQAVLVLAEVVVLYEWQQRHQYRHGSPTAPLYTPAPDYPYGTRPPCTATPTSAFSAPRPSEGHPRCISVPPSSADLGPPGTSRNMSPVRRPHMPAERVTVRPAGNRLELDGPFTASPRRAKSQLFKAATMERRSMPASGYITHTVSAPSLHGKTSDDTYMQLKKDLEYLDLKDQLEHVLDMSRQQMEQYQGQPAHTHKIAYQQRLLQEDLVTIRAHISRVSTEMSEAWKEYISLESSVEQLRMALQAHMNHSTTPQQEKTELKRELWRIEDVMAGLSASKANYKITIDSVQNPERKLVPEGVVIQPPSCSFTPGALSVPHATTAHWRQSDERKREREIGQYAANGDYKVELRSYLSEPELPVIGRSSTGSALDNPSFSDKGTRSLLRQV
ncbi:hypothetical protein CRUP_027791 [Coryphaenoides rupestris]|nr:hypothetical protein CRUP_027791 [Coryphaenoides rupestris]